MAEIGIDPSWEYGQFKSSDGGTEMWLHQRGELMDTARAWEGRDRGMENYREQQRYGRERERERLWECTRG